MMSLVQASEARRQRIKLMPLRAPLRRNTRLPTAASRGGGPASPSALAPRQGRDTVVAATARCCQASHPQRSGKGPFYCVRGK
jgi:hypothetical protein